MFGGHEESSCLPISPNHLYTNHPNGKEKTVLILILIGSVFPWEISTSISPGGESHNKDLDDVRESLASEISKEASREGGYNTSKNAHKWSESLVHNDTPFPVYGSGVYLDLRAPTLDLIDW